MTRCDDAYIPLQSNMETYGLDSRSLGICFEKYGGITNLNLEGGIWTCSDGNKITGKFKKRFLKKGSKKAKRFSQVHNYV